MLDIHYNKPQQAPIVKAAADKPKKAGVEGQSCDVLLQATSG